jgi:predicted metalloprotease
MEWQGRQGSSDIEDRRRSGARGVVAGGGICGRAVAAIGHFLGIDLIPPLDERQPSSRAADAFRQVRRLAPDDVLNQRAGPVATDRATGVLGNETTVHCLRGHAVGEGQG